jgi:hypothetical protein
MATAESSSFWWGGAADPRVVPSKVTHESEKHSSEQTQRFLIVVQNRLAFLEMRNRIGLSERRVSHDDRLACRRFGGCGR